MCNEWIPSAIGSPTDETTLVGRHKVPAGDCFSHWTCRYKYRCSKTKNVYSLGDLQNKYELGFGDQRLWDIIECEYSTEVHYIMNVNHPRYAELIGGSRDIVFDEEA